jgi:hypothetical protein
VLIIADPEAYAIMPKSLKIYKNGTWRPVIQEARPSSQE